MPRYSRALVQEWIRDGRVSVDATPEKRASRRLRVAEVVFVNPALRPPLEARPESIEISVLYEDADLAVIDKAAGMTVHAGAGVAEGTLVNALLHRMRNLSGVGGVLRPGIVHRLDRYTGGLVVVAKNDQAHLHLQRQFERREVQKRYWAIVEGVVPSVLGPRHRLLRHGRIVTRDSTPWLRIDAPIGRDRRNRTKMAVRADGRNAISDIRSLRRAARHTLLEVQIHTGRTHQVRVHVASAGHPVIGDTLYGARRSNPDILAVKRYMLHAKQLGITHPTTGETMQFEASLPPDFRECLEDLGL